MLFRKHKPIVSIADLPDEDEFEQELLALRIVRSKLYKCIPIIIIGSFISCIVTSVIGGLPQSIAWITFGAVMIASYGLTGFIGMCTFKLKITLSREITLITEHWQEIATLFDDPEFFLPKPSE